MPEEPQDGFRVEWWETNFDGTELIRNWAVFYVDKPYEELFPGEDRGGRPVRNEFMMYEQYQGQNYCRCEGRNTWDGLRGVLLEAHNIWFSFDEARAALRQRLAESISRTEQKLGHLRDARVGAAGLTMEAFELAEGANVL